MPRTAQTPTQGAPLTAADTSGSIPPPSVAPPAPAGPSAPPAPVAGADAADRTSGADEPDRAQAEALAKVASLAAAARDDDAPSRAMLATAITLGVLVIALLILAAAVSL